MDVLVSVPAGASSDDLRSLYGWLSQEDELRGAVKLVESPPGARDLGPTLDALQITAGSVSTAFVAVLVAWMRTRVGHVRIKMKTPGGSEVQLDAGTVRALDAVAVSELAADLVRSLEKPSSEAPPIEAPTDETP